MRNEKFYIKRFVLKLFRNVDIIDEKDYPRKFILKNSNIIQHVIANILPEKV